MPRPANLPDPFDLDLPSAFLNLPVGSGDGLAEKECLFVGMESRYRSTPRWKSISNISAPVYSRAEPPAEANLASLVCAIADSTPSAYTSLSTVGRSC